MVGDGGGAALATEGRYLRFEHYLNSVMNKVRADCCIDDAQLKVDLTTFIQQETALAQYHHRVNKRLFDLIPELRAAVP